MSKSKVLNNSIAIEKESAARGIVMAMESTMRSLNSTSRLLQPTVRELNQSVIAIRELLQEMQRSLACESNGEELPEHVKQVGIHFKVDLIRQNLSSICFDEENVSMSSEFRRLMAMKLNEKPLSELSPQDRVIREHDCVFRSVLAVSKCLERLNVKVVYRLEMSSIPTVNQDASLHASIEVTRENEVLITIRELA